MRRRWLKATSAKLQGGSSPRCRFCSYRRASAPVAGVSAGLAMGLNAIVTPAVIPVLLPWLVG